MKLIIGNEYFLKHTGQFSHCCGSEGYEDFSETRSEDDMIKATFVGFYHQDEPYGDRAIFISEDKVRKYISFGTDNYDYIIKNN